MLTRHVNETVASGHVFSGFSPGFRRFHQLQRDWTYAFGMNRGIWIVAAWLVAKHGTEAPVAVHSHIMSLRRALANEHHIASWLRIDDAVHELVRDKLKPSDTIH
jgi:hypothetical protein